MRAILRRFAVVALAALSFWCVLRTLERSGIAPFDFEPREGCVEALEQRFAPLRKYLPPVGIVGYAGPEEPAGGCNALYMAQFTLAPVIVSQVDDAPLRAQIAGRDEVVPTTLPLVIVDARLRFVNWLAEHPGYRPVARLGDVFLVSGFDPL